VSAGEFGEVSVLVLCCLCGDEAVGIGDVAFWVRGGGERGGGIGGWGDVSGADDLAKGW
jgi:hypothetical protein